VPAPLRELLKASGLSSRDIDEAVTQARGVTQRVAFWGGLLQKGLTQLADHPKVNRMRPALVLSSVLVEKVTRGASEMLKKR
jgi:plasmid stabilization system protein ParE